MRDDSLGIYCLSDKKFYYLETGSVYVSNTVDRLKKTLVKRNLIEFSDSSFINTEDYKVLSCREAKIDDLELVPIYISNHVKRSVQEQAKTDKSKGSNWG